MSMHDCESKREDRGPNVNDLEMQSLKDKTPRRREGFGGQRVVYRIGHRLVLISMRDYLSKKADKKDRTFVYCK